MSERLEIARKALATLDEILLSDLGDPVRRDAAIQRFEYSFEACWKTAKDYLAEREGVEEGTPKGVVRASFRADLLSEQEAEKALTMVDDRNLTSHAYNESLALAARLEDRAMLLGRWMDAIGEALPA